jgi:hypothetical protein
MLEMNNIISELMSNTLEEFLTVIQQVMEQFQSSFRFFLLKNFKIRGVTVILFYSFFASFIMMQSISSFAHLVMTKLRLADVRDRTERNKKEKKTHILTQNIYGIQNF